MPTRHPWVSIFYFFLLTFFLCVLDSKFAFGQDFESQIHPLEELLSQKDLDDSLRFAQTKRLIGLYDSTHQFQKLGDLTIDFFHLPSPDFDTDILKKNLLQRAIEFVPDIESTELSGNLYLKLAGAYFNLNDFDSAILSYSEAIGEFSDEDSIYIADAYFFRGQAHDYTGEFIPAMEDYHAAQDIYEILGDEEFVNHVRAGTAILFSKYGIYKEADSLRQTLLEVAREQGQVEIMVTQLYNRSNDLRKEGRSKEQIKALLLADSLRHTGEIMPYLLPNIQFAISSYYGIHGPLDSAEIYFGRGEQLMQQVSEFNENHPSYLAAKAQLELSKGNLESALTISQQALAQAQQSRNMDHLLRCYHLLEEIYEKSGKPGLALDYARMRETYQDSIFNANQNTSFAYYQTLYETEKREKEVLEKTVELESVQKESRQKTTLFSAALFGMVTLAGFGFLLVRLKSSKKEKQLQEAFSRELLKTQEEERKRISKDLHDGLGQSLLLIKNKVTLNQPENAGEMLDTAINELRSIARSLHPMQLEKLGLSQAIQEMLDQIDRETDIFVSAEIEDCKGKISKEKELQLYRITQEAINNILKHAEADALKLTLKTTQNKLTLSIADNGKGFDFSEKFNDFQSLGLKTLKERTAAISGIMNIITEKGKGTTLKFLIDV